MDISEIEQVVAQALSLLLQRAVGQEDNITMQVCAEWDSFKHIEIVMVLEEKLGVSFPAQDIPKLTSQRVIVESALELLQQNSEN